MNPNRTSAALRRGVLLVAAAGALYLAWRFEGHSLGAEGCSPLLRYSPGDALLVDRHPPPLGEGDAILFHGPSGLLNLALVQRVRPASTGGGQELWVETDRPDCPAVDSAKLGWIDGASVRGRVVMVWPW